MPTVGSNLGNLADFKAPTEKEPGIIAFSGSGRDFDEFKLEKVGTGTGEAVFGNGLYFTDVEDIAQFYRRSLEHENTNEKIKYKNETIGNRLDQKNNEAGTLTDEVSAILDIVRETRRGVSPDEAKENLLRRIDATIEKFKNSNEVKKNNNEAKILKTGQTVEEFFIEERVAKTASFAKLSLTI